MSSRSASALLDAALAVPFDPEEEDRRQLALARQATWDSGPVSPSVVDIAPEPAFVPDPLVADADAAMGLPPAPVSDELEPALPMEDGGSGGPALPQADEDLPPLAPAPSADQRSQISNLKQGGGRRSASALLAEVLPEATAAEQRTAGPAVPTGGTRRRSAAALLADVPEDSGVLRRAGDVPIFIAQGITTGLKGLTDAFGADNAASQALAANQDFYQAQLSPEAQASQQRVAQIQAAAADQGVMAQLGAAGRAFAESPTAFVAQGVGTMAPTIALGAAGKAVGLGARGVQAVQTATGATMGGGIVKGEIYQAVEQAMLQAGRSPEEAAEAASTAQAYGGENLDQILAGYGLGALATAIGAERLAGRAIAGAAAPTGGVLRVAGRTALQEALPEAAQGGQEQLARNLAQQREDFNVPTMRGVVGAGALEGLAGLAIGGPAGVAAGAGARMAPQGARSTEQGAGAMAAAAAAPAPVRRVVVEADDVFGEATTTAVDEPGAGSMEPGAGDERFAPPPAAEQPAPAAAEENLFGEVEQRGETIVTPPPAAAETVGLEAAAVERFQWMRNKEGGQAYGNQQISVPLTEEIFEQEIKPRIRPGYADTLAAYQAKHPDETHASYLRVAGQGEWQYSGGGSLETVRPNPPNRGWAMPVESFDSPMATGQAATADSEAFPTQQRTAGPAVPTETQTTSGGDAAATMLSRRAARFSARADQTAGGQGTAVGSVGIDERIIADTLQGMSQAIAAGTPVAEAAAQAKTTARELVAAHNSRRRGDVNWQRSETLADKEIDNAAADVTDLQAGRITFDEQGFAQAAEPTAKKASKAKARIKKKMSTQSGAIDVSILEDIVEYGRTVYRAGMDLATWSAKMVKEFGQGVAQFLRQAFDRIVAAYRDSRFADTTGAVGDVRPRQTKPRQLEEKAMRNESLAAETRARLGSEYLPISLNAQAEAAKEWINTNGLDAAKLRIAQLSGEDSVPTPLDFAIGIEAAGRLSAVGDHQGAADIVSTMSHRATGMGQTISTLAMMARLSPEGIVFYGENIIRRYINALPPEAQDRIRALQAEVARLKAELAKAKFDQGSEVIRSGKLGDEKIQDRIKRRQRAKVTADLGPAASGPEVTAETRARVISMNRAVRDVLLGDSTKAMATKAIEAILLEQGNLSAAEAAAMAKSIADAFFKLMRETRTRLTNEARTKALPTKARGFEKLLELLRSGKDVSDAEFTGNVAQLLGLPGMTPTMARELRALAQRYERATDPDVKMVLGQMMFEKAHEIIPVEFFSKVRAFAYLAMLFSPKTWIKNFLGNQILWVAHIGRDAFISGIMDPAMSLLTGKRTLSGVHFAKRARALLTPIEDVRKGYLWNKQENPEANQWQNFMAGVNHLRVLSKLTSQNKFEIADVKNVGGRIFSSKFMRFFDTGLSIALGAGDRAFWMAEFRAKLAQMQAAAEKNGEWSGQPTPEMIEAAMAEAAYAIFQNPNVLSQGLGEMRKWTNFLSTGGRSKELGLGTNLLTFTQVPGSITLRGVIDWSPLGFIGALYRGMRGILYASSTGRMGAKFDQAAFNKEFTQALLGTGTLYVAGYYLYALGIVSASREDDDDLEAMRRASGLGQYRINVTALRRALLSGNWFQRQEGQDGDYIVPYDWAQPLAITFAAGAELAAQAERTSREQLKKGGVKPQGMAATIFKLSGTKSLEELPLLSGLSSFMKAWGYGGPVDAVANTVAGMPAMFMPQVVRQWMQFQDNMQRETQAGDSVQREFMKVLATVPWYSKTFPLKFDTMGQAIERYQYGGNNVFNVLLNPTVAREVKMNPVMQEISRLVDATGETGMAPKKVDRTATINGQKVELTNNQIAAYQYYLGNFTMAHFTWRMAAPVYARLPDELKAKMLTDDIQDIDAAVKSAVLGHDMRRLTRKQLFLRNALVNSPLGRSVPAR